MSKTREEYIRSIRANIPYMSEQDLSFVDSFIRGLNSPGFSIAEYDRPVRSLEKENEADVATSCMRTIGWSLSNDTRGVTGCFLQEEGGDQDAMDNLLGIITGDLVTLDARKVAQLYREAGWKRVKQASLWAWMEEMEYILPRSGRPKTAILNGEKREVLYMPIKRLNPFLEEVQK
ncbi:MAG: hypothetical protein ACI3WQ_05680 [Faecousia sp.]